MSHQADTAVQNANVILGFVRESTSSRCSEAFTALHSSLISVTWNIENKTSNPHSGERNSYGGGKMKNPTLCQETVRV